MKNVGKSKHELRLELIRELKLNKITFTQWCKGVREVNDLDEIRKDEFYKIIDDLFEHKEGEGEDGVMSIIKLNKEYFFTPWMVQEIKNYIKAMCNIDRFEVV